jgi:hypothetical protein
MARIRFVREYKAYDGVGTIYDVVYESRVNTYYIDEKEGYGKRLPKTVQRYMDFANIKIQNDRWHGVEKIYEA